MKKLSYAIMIAILFVGLTGCGDDSSTGPDPKEEAPAIPDLSVYAQPDISFFENNQPPGKKGKMGLNNQYSNYSTANLMVTVGSMYASLGQLYLGFLGPAYNKSPEFKNGQWEWSYSYSAQGASASIRYTAEDQGSSTKWQMFMSGDDGQGESYNNYKLMEGNTSNDGTKGNWTFNALGEDNTTEVPFIITEWDAKSDTERTLTSEIHEDGSSKSTIEYEQDGVKHTMIFDDAGSSDTDTIFWNTDTKTGYVIDDGDKKCWDENLANTPC